MKITSNRREDILKRKAEYEEDVARRSKQVEEEERAYEEAELAVTNPVKAMLADILAKYPRLSAEIRVERGGRFGGEGIRVEIRVNDRDVHDKSKALSWNYDAYINDGEVIRETGSWSGLQAVTPEQLEHLEQSVACLKELSTLDWEGILNKTMPNYKDYLHTMDPRYDRNKPDFDAELAQVELEDIIGQRKMIEVQPFTTSWYYNDRLRTNPNVFVAILKDSGSQYTIVECPKRSFENGEGSKYFDANNYHRVKKEAIKPVKPFNIQDV